MILMPGGDRSSARGRSGCRRSPAAVINYVRLEIELALQLDKVVIPVLINKTDVPRGNALPATLKPLAQFPGSPFDAGARSR